MRKETSSKHKLFILTGISNKNYDMISNKIYIPDNSNINNYTFGLGSEADTLDNLTCCCAISTALLPPMNFG